MSWPHSNHQKHNLMLREFFDSPTAFPQSEILSKSGNNTVRKLAHMFTLKAAVKKKKHRYRFKDWGWQHRIIHNNKHDVMAALAGWERKKTKRKTTFLLAPANLFRTQSCTCTSLSLFFFSQARALTALDETKTRDHSLLRGVPPQHGRASSGFGCVTADKTACHGCVDQGRATTACCNLPARTVAHRWSSSNQAGGSCACVCFHAKCHRGSGVQWDSAEAGHSWGRQDMNPLGGGM